MYKFGWKRENHSTPSLTQCCMCICKMSLKDLLTLFKMPLAITPSDWLDLLDSKADSGSHFCDPWPAWPVTHGPVPDHGMSRSRLLTNHDEFTTSLLPSLLCNDVQSEILDMANYFVNISIVHRVSLVVYTLHGNFYKVDTVKML